MRVAEDEMFLLMKYLLESHTINHKFSPGTQNALPARSSESEQSLTFGAK